LDERVNGFDPRDAGAGDFFGGNASSVDQASQFRSR
jgi:hypothetical protein